MMDPQSKIEEADAAHLGGSCERSSHLIDQPEGPLVGAAPRPVRGTDEDIKAQVSGHAAACDGFCVIENRGLPVVWASDPIYEWFLDDFGGIGR